MHDELKGQVPRGLVVLKSGIDAATEGERITRELVEMMGGTVLLESRPGRTAVRVVLGAAPTSLPAPEPVSTVST